MFPIVNTTAPATPAPAPQKPWALGDPSSFQQLFSSNFPSSVAAATPAASAPAPAPAPSSNKPWAPGDPSSFEQLFSANPPATFVAVPPAPAPTPALALFTFEQNATVTGFNTTTQLNPEELATADTADRLAAMLGGKVVSEPDLGGGFSNSVPTRDIVFADSKVTLNAGVTAYLFNTYGDRAGSPAWQQINQILGRDLMSTKPVS
jgi:hypothetical protein